MRYIDLFAGRKIHYDRKGYPVVSLNGKEKKVHILVWEEANGRKPKGYDIHHIDKDKKNFNFENLVLVTSQEHKRIHAGWVKKGNKWVAKPCNGCNQILECDRMWELWLDKELGHTSQGQKYIEQLFIQLRGSLSKLSQPNSPLRLNRIYIVSDTQRYKTLGNAVTVNVVEHIIRGIL